MEQLCLEPPEVHLSLRDRVSERTTCAYLEERDPKRDPGDDSQVGLHHIGHQCEAALRSRGTHGL